MPSEPLSVPARLTRFTRATAGLAGARLGTVAGHVVHDEAAFRHFLSIEWKRAERAHRLVLLVLIRFRTGTFPVMPITPQLESLLFAGLAESLREVDFIGWYRDKRVAAGVLTQGAAPVGAEATRRIAERVTRDVGAALPPAAAGCLRVRVVTLRPVMKPQRFPE